ncbi:hypothetical protein [Vibrio furnissii]|uniref:hypothetical protein n=1 Tax=Vibrio furnissii TaxID=29494 RepID=UPI001EEA0242|nr:hypothetical protein [Vibrio furnissii]MCG6228705.1 hypothetical protein [Vibrio furnissii]
MKEFSYYFKGVRCTNTDLEFLQSLVENEHDPQGVIDGILESKARFDESVGDN